ncbi:unnamed protein product [Malus baccata var. baccata]
MESIDHLDLIGTSRGGLDHLEEIHREEDVREEGESSLVEDLREKWWSLGNSRWKEEVYPSDGCDDGTFTFFFALVKMRRAKSSFFSSATKLNQHQDKEQIINNKFIPCTFAHFDVSSLLSLFSFAVNLFFSGSLLFFFSPP